MPSPAGWAEVPCARCGERVRGLGWGELCPACRRALGRRASRLAGRIALGATVLAALYVALRLPADPMARYYGALAVVVTYVLVRRIAARIALEVLK